MNRVFDFLGGLTVILLGGTIIVGWILLCTTIAALPYIIVALIVWLLFF